MSPSRPASCSLSGGNAATSDEEYAGRCHASTRPAAGSQCPDRAVAEFAKRKGAVGLAEGGYGAYSRNAFIKPGVSFVSVFIGLRNGKPGRM